MAHFTRKRRKKSFTLGTPKNAAILLWLAEQKGLFADHGVTLNFKNVVYSRKALDMLIAGEIDLAALVETNVAYLGYLKPKVPIKCFASIQKRFDDEILMRGENKCPADLKGKRIAFMPRTGSHSFLYLFLDHYGLQKTDVSLKVLNPQAMPDALVRGDVDAISCWKPHTLFARTAMDELGIEYSCFENTGFYASEVVLAAAKPFLIKHESTIKNILAALRDANTLFDTDPKTALNISAQKLGISRPLLEQYWHEFQPVLGDMNAAYLENVKFLSEWIQTQDTEFIGKDLPDYSDCLEHRFFIDAQ